MLSEVTPPPMLVRAEPNSPVPAVEPCSLTVRVPLRLDAMSPVNFTLPVPDWSNCNVPLLAVRLKLRLFVSPAPE